MSTRLLMTALALASAGFTANTELINKAPWTVEYRLDDVAPAVLRRSRGGAAYHGEPRRKWDRKATAKKRNKSWAKGR